jgi:hypothetical protein
MHIARLPHLLREYRYFHCYDDLTGEPLGFLVSFKFVPCWIRGSWTLEVKGLNWNEETAAEYCPDQLNLLRVTGVQVSISELAWCLHRAEQVVAIAREVIGHHDNFEQAAELTLSERYRMVTKVVMANGLNDRFHMSLLEAEHFLLSIAPVADRRKDPKL